ncbi:MAG: DUF5682 family protein [Acidobacteriota bacterium]
MSFSVFGIRHHGPGSARSLLQALEALQPDCLLVEGPPDADNLLPMVRSEELRPPVAILVYRPEEPRHYAFYPFAEFSPEWQAIRYALEHDVTVRFMDLPQKHQLGLPPEEADEPPSAEQAEEGAVNAEIDEVSTETPEAPRDDSEAPRNDPEAPRDDPEPPRGDPLGWLGRAAGYADGEDWWENMVEQRLDGADLFAAVHEAMATLREEFPRRDAGDRDAGDGDATDRDATDRDVEALREDRREAHMRRTLRQAKKEGFDRIAVVCGAWHAPALLAKVKVGDDNALLKGLPKTKVAATWVPWTYGRLALASGYGAGIPSPGWYHHLWRSRRADPTADQADSAPRDSASPNRRHSRRASVEWLTRVARLLRDKDLDCSSAHVIEAVRLAECLAALRQRPMPSLAEMNEAALSVMCLGEAAPLRLIEDQLSVGERLGSVPEDAPSVPLQRDIEARQRRLRLKPVAFEQTIDLDLRKPNGLARSRLLHRLALLDIPWGETTETSGKKGTFHEVWKLTWQPELAVRIIEASMWGNTVPGAAAAWVDNQAAKADLAGLSRLVDRVLLADLPATLEQLMARLDAEAARASDIFQLMEALSPLARVMRYGDVRGTDSRQIGRVVDGLVTRLAIGLPLAAASLDDTAAERMAEHLARADSALRLLESATYLESWQRALAQVMRLPSVNGLLSGRCCRLLLDAGRIDHDEVASHMSLALSTANETTAAANWLEGFLAGSGMVLLHDDRLWSVLDEWLGGLSADAFVHALPLLRRTFSKFAHGERQQMGQRVKASVGSHRRAPGTSQGAADGEPDLDHDRAARVLPTVLRFLGLEGAA